MKIRHLFIVVFALASLWISPAWAEEVEEAIDEDELIDENLGGKTLAERIPSVTRRKYLKKGRVELSPSLGLSLNDPFYDHVITSAAASYYLFESIWIGVSADFYISRSKTIPIVGSIATNKPEYNKPVYATRLEIAWVPFYGKLNIMAEKVLHFDMYVGGGVGLLGPSKSPSTIAGSFVAGMHIFLNDWMALRLEPRDQVFTMARDPKKDKKKRLQNFFTFTLGFCFFLPPEVEREDIRIL